MERSAGRRFRDAVLATAPTREGWGLLWIGAALLLCASVTGRASLYAGASLTLGLYLVGHLGAAWGRASLGASWECPSRVFAGEDFPLRLTLRNRGPVAVGGIEVFYEPHEAPSRVREGAVVAVLGAGAAAPVEVRARVRRRGFHRLEAPRLRVSWPFPLAAAVLHAGDPREVLAYPRRVPVPSRALRSRSPETVSRQVAAAVSRGGELFRGVRDWAPGDPPRAIAWRATARHERLLTREFEREDSGRAVVALDADPRGLGAAERGQAVERACSVAASLVLRLRAEGRRTAFAAWTPEPVFAPSASSERSLGRVLEAMALLEPPRRGDPRRDPVALLPRSALHGARVILVRAAMGPVRTARGSHGSEVVVVPALQAFLPPGRRP